MSTKELKIPRLYNKIAKHYLKIERLTKDKLLSIVDTIDDIAIFYDGKNSVTIRGTKGSYIGERKAHQVDWKKFVTEKIKVEEEEDVKPRRSKRPYKKRRTFGRK